MTVGGDSHRLAGPGVARAHTHTRTHTHTHNSTLAHTHTFDPPSHNLNPAPQHNRPAVPFTIEFCQCVSVRVISAGPPHLTLVLPRVQFQWLVTFDKTTSALQIQLLLQQIPISNHRAHLDYRPSRRIHAHTHTHTQYGSPNSFL